MPDEPYLSLYRRYRPQRFGEVRGQEHVTSALRNAVRNDRVAHAYLFSGPRGTGKTSTARILAKALNCTNLQDGEPCCECESCLAVQAGTSLDVVELDAASNNGVDAMRDLVARAALGSPGRRKVYIVDEVHMLTTAASNALLKTLEEPPAHVVFVLATTDPQKVLPTIRSRTQPYEFRLLSPELLGTLLADVNDQAGLGLDSTTLDRVVVRGNGSARDALSALDQAAAAGGAEDEVDAVPAIVEAVAGRDAGAALVAAAAAVQRGRDPSRLAVEVVEYLRAAFLLTMAPGLAGIPDHQVTAYEDHARRLGTAALVRAMEVLGEALVDMREALDARVTLETALVRLCVPAADTSPAAIVERLEALERRVAAGGGPAGRPSLGDAGGSPARPSPDTGASRSGTEESASPGSRGPGPGAPPPAPAGPVAPPREAPSPSSARPTIGAVRQQAPATIGSDIPPQPVAQPAARAGGVTVDVDRDELTRVWGDEIFPAMSPGVRSRYRMGRWTAVAGGEAVFALPSLQYRDRAEQERAEVETALAARFGGRIAIRLEVDDAPATGGAGGPSGGSSGPARRASSPGRSGPAGARAPIGPGTDTLDAAPPAPPPYEGPLPAGPPGDIDEEVSTAEFADLDVAPSAPASAEARLMEALPGTEDITG